MFISYQGLGALGDETSSRMEDPMLVLLVDFFQNVFEFQPLTTASQVSLLLDRVDQRILIASLHICKYYIRASYR